MRSLALVVLPLAASCALDPVPLGDDALDGAKLSDTAAAYLVDALGDDVTLQGLLERGAAGAAEVTFAAAPDPTPLLVATSALDDDRGRRDKVPVTVLSYNVALLDAQIFGVIDYRITPTLDERRRALPDLIFEGGEGEGGEDVICLQEVWEAEDVATFTQKAEAHGYRAYAQPRDGYNDGVMVLVKESAIAGGTSPALVDSGAYGSQDDLEFFPGPGIRRGWLEVAFTHATAGPARIFCTHMQAFPEAWLGRMKQARELGIAARTHARDDELVIVAGDLNAGPYYAAATWQPPAGEEQTFWFHNALAYPLLLAWGGLVDAAVMGRPVGDAASDVTIGDTVVNDAAASLEIPGAAEGWCDALPTTTLTGVDCNSLYFQQYAGTEFPARLDHVHVRDRPDLVVASSRLVFTAPRSFGDGRAAKRVEPSDHYGVRVELLVDAR